MLHTRGRAHARTHAHARALALALRATTTLQYGWPHNCCRASALTTARTHRTNPCAPPTRSLCARAQSSGGNHTYPGQLQIFLDEAFPGKYAVTNLGACGSTMLKQSNSPYWKRPQYTTLTTNKWDIIIIMLGTNDAKVMRPLLPPVCKLRVTCSLAHRSFNIVSAFRRTSCLLCYTAVTYTFAVDLLRAECPALSRSAVRCRPLPSTTHTRQ